MKNLLTFLITLTLIATPAFAQVDTEARADIAASKAALVKAGIMATAAGQPSTPAPTPAPAAATAIAATQYKAVHFDSGVRTPQRVRWLIDGKAREGFNAAMIPTSVGQLVNVKADDGTSKTWRINSLTSVTLKPVPVGTDLAPLLTRGARLKLAAGSYTLSRPITDRDIIVDGAGLDKTRINWTGVDRPLDARGKPYTVTIFTIADSAISNLTIDSTRRYVKGDGSEQSKRPALFAGQADLTLSNVGGVDVDMFLNANTAPPRVFVQGCVGIGLRNYFAWFEGTDLVFYDNRADNSYFQHIARGCPSVDGKVYAYSRVVFDSNVFANQDNTAKGDPNDVAKGTIVAQGGELLYRHANTLDGPSGLGPLAVGDNGIPSARTSNCVIADDKTNRAVDLWPGLQDALIVNTPCAIREQRKDTRRVQRVNIFGIPAIQVPAWADAITQKAAA